MLSQKRPARRTPLGTRVAAPRSDGYYHCGCVDAGDENPAKGRTVTVRFDDGLSREYEEDSVVGPGFLTTSDVMLRPGQTVYIVRGGREVKCQFLRANASGDAVVLDGTLEVLCRLEDVRLVDSRRSARPTDFAAEADQRAIGPPTTAASPYDPRRKAVTPGIDVPSRNRRRKHDDEDVSMDERMAALVLTSMSCSPASPQHAGDFGRSPRSWTEGAAGSPSPPSMLSMSAPTVHCIGSPSTDEGIDIEDVTCQVDEVSPKKRKSASPARTTYVCTWKGCGFMEADCTTMERHVREAHLGPRIDSDSSDHEEEFYYNELVTSEVDVVGDADSSAGGTAAAAGSASVSSAMAHMQPYDHDYQRKESKKEPRERRGSSGGGSSSSMGTPPITIPLQASTHYFPMNSPYGRSPKTMSPATSSPTGLQAKMAAAALLHSSSASPRKQRSEVKKCRKVYGMENRELWCTQCKWKKACTRFHND